MSLSARFGWLGANATHVHAALLAAHGAASMGAGFRPADVRFFFLLFTNWAEHDVLHPGQDLDLTQVRRMLDRLTRARLAAPVKSPKRPSSTRGRRHSLTEAGVVAIAEALVQPGQPRTFEETVFVLCFAVGYGEMLASRIVGAGGRANPSTRRRVVELLDPRRVLADGKRSLTTLLVDLEERVRSGLVSSEAGRAGGGPGGSEADTVRRLERAGAYQLQHVRPLAEFLLTLPDDLRAFELTRGMQLRAELLFAPLAEGVRAQQAILDALGAKLRP